MAKTAKKKKKLEKEASRSVVELRDSLNRERRGTNEPIRLTSDSPEANSPDDEAPEDVKLETSKYQAFERMKKETEAAKRLKSSVKEKRRQKAELYKMQKESKRLRRLQAFPEEELKEAISKMAQMRQPETTAMDDDKGDREATSKQHKGTRSSVTQVGSVKIVSAVGMGGVVKEEEEKDYRQERALQFLHDHFYGGQQRRVSALSQQSRRHRNKPALNFTTSK